jgi:hypothetical protein
MAAIIGGALFLAWGYLHKTPGAVYLMTDASALPLAPGAFGWSHQLTDVVGAGTLRLIHVVFGILFALC